MEKRDVLRVLSRIEVRPGVSVTASGHLQDILFEPYGTGTYVALIVDPKWGEEPLPRTVVEAIEAGVAAMKGVSLVRVLERERLPVAPRPRPAPPRGLPEGARVLAVASGKGGVGKSTVSVNLAVALRRSGIPTAVIDCDMYGFSVPALIGLATGPTVDPETKRIDPPTADGIPVMSLEFFVRGNDAVAWRGPMLGKALRQFVSTVNWPKADVFVLDLPPGTGDILLDVQEFFDRSFFILVTTPDPFAARVAERAGSLALKSGRPLLGVVENMAFLRCADCSAVVRPWGRGGADQVAANLGTDVIARLPLVSQVDSGIGALAPEGTELSDLYNELAARVWDALGAEAEARTSRNSPSQISAKKRGA